MAGIENIRLIEQHTPSELQPDDELKELGLSGPPKGEHPLDRPEVRKRFNRVYDWWMQELVRQADVRAEALRDHEIYDGPGQWTAEEMAILRERLQEPLVFNQVKPTVDWVLGSEKKLRLDYRVMPRGEEDAQAAEIKTKGIKYLSDVNRTGFKRSRAFADAVISGVGWLDHGISGDAEDEPIQVRYEDWRNVWYDSLSVEPDYSDARYVFRGKWVDEDIAIAYFPDRADVIHAAANEDAGTLFGDPSFDLEDISNNEDGYNTDALRSGFYSYAGEVGASRRSRVFLVEAWYRVPARKKILRGKGLGALNGAEFDPDDPNHATIVAQGLGSPVDTIQMEVRQMIFCGSHVLHDSVSPYRHNRFPLVPIWGYRRKRDNAPYGMVRNLRDPQRDLNKRRSKALYILNSNKTIVEEDAFVGTLQEFYDSRQRPDGVTLMRKDRIGAIRDENDRGIAREHIELMQQDERYIQNTSGVTDELMARETNAVSGVAIKSRQEQGQVVVAELFDNYRLAFQLSGEIQLSLMEQYWTGEKVFRIVGEGNTPEYVHVSGAGGLNDITATKADFVISEQDYSATIRRAMFETLGDMATRMPPEVAIQLLDLVFDLSDLPGKEKFVERIRQLNGQKDPNAEHDPNAEPEIDPAEQAKLQQMETQNRILQTQLAGEQAKVAKLEAEARLVQAKIGTEMVNQRVAVAGVGYDQEKLKIERAQTLNAIEQAEHGRRMMELAQREQKKPGDGVSGDSEPVQRNKGQQGSTERGLKSNNQEKA